MGLLTAITDQISLLQHFCCKLNCFDLFIDTCSVSSADWLG